MLEGGRTPFLTPAELEQHGFRLVIYGISLLMHVGLGLDAVFVENAISRTSLVLSL
jgi:2-methylisocitrate lyase-like PEP mutase family enzyme